MRVAGLFKRLLRLGRERIVGIELVEEGEVVVVDVALPAELSLSHHTRQRPGRLRPWPRLQRRCVYTSWCSSSGY
jgi:hypothetical protein